MAFDSQLFPAQKQSAAGTLLLQPPALRAARAEETRATDYTDMLCAGALASPAMSLITSTCAERAGGSFFLLVKHREQ